MNPIEKAAILVLGPSSLSGLIQNTDSYTSDLESLIFGKIF